MTQVLSVSANTAAYVADNLRVLNRTPRTNTVEESIKALARRLNNGEDHKIYTTSGVMRPTSLSLYFMTSSLNQQPQANWKQVEDAYEEQAQDE